MAIPKILPDKYYLTHFNEMLSQLKSHSMHLLGAECILLLNRFEKLSESAKCLYLRIVSRKGDAVRIDSMNYKEILHTDVYLQELIEAKLIKRAETEDFIVIFEFLRKKELSDFLSENGLKIPLSRPKLELFSQSKALLRAKNATYSGVNNWIINTTSKQIDYLNFLYFGDANQKLNQFSLRDLGIRGTRKRVKGSARFENICEAKSAYHWENIKKQLNADNHNLNDLWQQCQQGYDPVGSHAEQIASDCLWALGKVFKTQGQNMEKAMFCFKKSSHPKAFEQWLREQYKMGNKTLVQKELEEIIAQPNDPDLALFAKDFYQRKYEGKRLSTLTDWLRNNSQTLTLDPAHSLSVEKAVCQYYKRRGCESWKTENMPWKALFALTFWELIFNQASRAVSSEFDRVPRVIKENRLYAELESQIKSKLLILDSPEHWFNDIARTATKNYGCGNGMFRWYPSLLSSIKIILDGVPLAALKNQMLAMSKNYKGLKDGYPDIMVKKGNQIHFEEIKAPGDQVRRNQAITLKAMQKAGIPQKLTRVEWGFDPSQAYAVVDVETTGGVSEGNRITEIGIVTVVGNEITGRWSSLVNPQRAIPPSITRLTGISNDMVKDAPVFSDLIDELDEQINDKVFVAHNVGFDAGFFSMEYSKLNRNFRYPRLCTRDETKRIDPELKRYGLSRLSEYYNIELHNHHRALDDALAAAHLLIRRNNHLREFGLNMLG